MSRGLPQHTFIYFASAQFYETTNNTVYVMSLLQFIHQPTHALNEICGTAYFNATIF